MNPYLELLLEGALGGAMVFLVATVLGPWRRQALAVELVLAGLAYIRFVMQTGQGPLWLGLEVLGLVLYGLIGRRGVRGSPWWLVAGWALHPVWDIALHFFGPGRAFAPESYTVACLTWDLMIAGLLAFAILRRKPIADQPSDSSIARARRSATPS